MKTENYLPLTNKQLSEIVECYATAFPGWQLVDGQVFARAWSDSAACRHRNTAL